MELGSTWDRSCTKSEQGLHKCFCNFLHGAMSLLYGTLLFEIFSVERNLSRLVERTHLERCTCSDGTIHLLGAPMVTCQTADKMQIS